MARRRSRRTQDTGAEDGGTDRRSRRGRRGRTEEVVSDEVFEDIEVAGDEEELLSDSALEELVEDDSADTYESVNDKRKSSRRSAGGGRRSSRRSPAASDRDDKKSSRRSKRKELSPEERIAKRKAQLAFIKLIVGLAVAGGIAYLILLMVSKDPNLVKANQDLEYAKSGLEELDTLIEHGQLTEADAKYTEIEELLAGSHYAIFGPEMQHKVDTLNESLVDRGPRIVEARDEQTVMRNLNDIKSRLDRIATPEERENPTIDLDQLVIDITDFRSNPLDPKGGAPMENAEFKYKSLFGQLAGAEGRIKSERDYRGNTDSVESEARIAIGHLMTQRNYKRAYEELENYKAKHPNADFSGIERGLDSSVEQAWDGARRTVEDCMKTANSDGASAVMKEENKKKAKDVLQKVISDYNDKYVRMARDLMDEHDL